MISYHIVNEVYISNIFLNYFLSGEGLNNIKNFVPEWDETTIILPLNVVQIFYIDRLNLVF